MNALPVRTIALSLFLAPALASQPPAAPAIGQPNPQATPEPARAENTPPTAADRLAASAKVYAEARTYRDEGLIVDEMQVQGGTITSKLSFETAFERGGRFRWQCRHSAVPGAAPGQRYTLWSADGEAFNSFWTLTGDQKGAQTLDTALAGPTCISSGAATAIIPMLGVSKADARWGGRTTDIEDPADKGKETTDGVQCWKIEGTERFSDGKVTLWIDEAGLVRKIRQERSIETARLLNGAEPGEPPVPKFATTTTITIKPVINEAKIDDAKFTPDEKNADGPEK